jgi:hypothetical protein
MRFVRLWSPARMERVAPMRAAQVRRQPGEEGVSCLYGFTGAGEEGG